MKKNLKRIFSFLVTILVLCTFFSQEANCVDTYLYVTVQQPEVGGAVEATRENSDTFNVVATPYAGYAFKRWVKVDGDGRFWDVSQPQTRYTRLPDPMPPIIVFVDDSYATITAEFGPTFNITTSVVGQGTVTAEPSSNVIEGTTVNLTASPEAGYRFKEWRSEDATITADPEDPNKASFPMPAKNVSITAVFEALYNVTTSVSGHGTAGANPSSDVTEGTTVNLTASPESGYRLAGWSSEDVTVTADPEDPNKASFSMPAKNVTVTATFEPIMYNITTSVEGNGSAAAEPTSGITGTSVNITATPGEGSLFKNWEVVSGGVTLDDPESASTSFTIGTQPVEVKAVFESVYNVTTSVEGEGTATAIPTSGPNGTNVTIKAVPAEGYQFKNWEVISGGVTLANPNSSLTTFEMGEDHVEVKAIFEEITVTGISLNSENAKKEYTVGDELDLNNLVLTLTKSDGSTETIAVTEDMVSGFDGSKAGVQTVTVTYEGFTDTYEVEVKEKQVDPTPTPTPVTPTNNGSGSPTNSSATNYESSGKSGSTTTIPDTGDHGKYTLWILAMIASLAGLIFSSQWWQKRRFSRR